MQFSFAHNNFNVRDLDRSLSFYKEALGLTESSRINAPDGSFIIVYLTDGVTPHLLELTWLRDWDKPYNLGDNEFHLAFRVDDFDAAHAKHKEMDCICFENPAMGIYFISDPDCYWLEVIPAKSTENAWSCCFERFFHSLNRIILFISRQRVYTIEVIS